MNPGQTDELVKDCRDPWTLVYVRANGDVMPCCHSLQRMGNLSEGSLAEIWNGPGYATFRRFLLSRTPLPVCQSCFVRGWRKAPKRSVTAHLGHLVEGAAVLLGLSSGLEVVPVVRIDKPTYRPADHLNLSVGLRVGNASRCRRVDLFVFADDPLGRRHWVRTSGRMIVGTAEPGPTLSNFEPFSFTNLDLLRMTLAGWPCGEYRLCAFVTPPGSKIQDERSRLGQSEVEFILEAGDAQRGA